MDGHQPEKKATRAAIKAPTPPRAAPAPTDDASCLRNTYLYKLSAWPHCIALRRHYTTADAFLGDTNHHTAYNYAYAKAYACYKEGQAEVYPV